MINGKVVSVIHKGLDRDSFASHPVWCDYHHPEEIDYLVSLGEDRNFLVRELIEFEELKESGETYYSLPVAWVEKLPQFLYVFSEFEIDGKPYLGYSCIVDGSINAFSIFKSDEAVDFYVNKLLSDDNREGMAQLGAAYPGEFARCSVRFLSHEAFRVLENINKTQLSIPLK